MMNIIQVSAGARAGVFVFGLNAFLRFLKGPIPRGLAGQFLQTLFESYYVLAIGAVQAVGGALLLIKSLCSAGAGDSWAGPRLPRNMCY
jgi:hypothetical protein